MPPLPYESVESLPAQQLDDIFNQRLAPVDHISRLLFEKYFDSRQRRALDNEARRESIVVCEDVVKSVGQWIENSGIIPEGGRYTKEEYATPDRKTVTERFRKLEEYLLASYSDVVKQDDIDVNNQFLEATFAMHQDTPEDDAVAEDADGSFAFVVPARLSRENIEYGEEVEEVIPLLKYVPRNLRASMMIGLPAFVIDRYQVDEHGKRGYLVFAPMYGDMIADIGIEDAAEVADKQVNDAVDFAYSRFGTKVVGLGAILPSLTDFGRTIRNQNVITTTGHGGTVHLIIETARRALAEGRLSAQEIKRVGALGLGSIGASIAGVSHDTYPDAIVTIYDIREQVTQKVHERTGLPMASSVRDLIEKSDVIFSAVTSKIDLDQLGLKNDALAGKVIVDDSQPASFDPEQVQAYSGTVAWVVGRGGGMSVRGDFTYGNTMNDARDVFGCEAEAATLAAHYLDLVASGSSLENAEASVREIAIRDKVTPARVHGIAKLFVKYGVTAAPLQAFGKLV